MKKFVDIHGQMASGRIFWIFMDFGQVVKVGCFIEVFFVRKDDSVLEMMPSVMVALVKVAVSMEKEERGSLDIFCKYGSLIAMYIG